MGAVYVAGSVNMDVVVAAPRYPQIGETIAGSEIGFFPGGKGANQAVAAARLGARTALIGRVGADAFGRELRTFLNAQQIDLQRLSETPLAATGTAQITLVDGSNTIIVVAGANARLGEADVSDISFVTGDVAVSQFEIPPATVRAFFAQARAKGARTILNPAPAGPIGDELMRLTDVLILNETELSLLAGAEVNEGSPPARIAKTARAIRADRTQTICVTLGARGALAVLGDETMTVPGRPVSAVDSTGAGDCFTGAVAARLAAGDALPSALHYANAAASLCVQRKGAGPSMPIAAEVAQALTTMPA